MKRRLLSRFSRLATVAATLLAVPVTTRAAIVIDETNFPDENFRQYLLEENYGKDGVLTNDEIQKVKSISVWRMDIKSLEGIKVFTELKELACPYNQLTELDVSGLALLQTIFCAENQLTKLDITGCNSLVTLSIANNQLAQLDVSKCTILSSLTCQNNLLTSLDVRKCTKLSIFNCSVNQLTSLNVSGCNALESLYCSGNQLTELVLTGCTALMTLACHYNQLAVLDVSACKSLHYFHCYQNRIRGKAMDDLVASMPKSNAGRFNVYEEEAGDWNAISYDQVDAARAKGWTVQSLFEDEWLEYDGEDPESVAPVPSEKADGPWYDLQGRRLQKAPKKGLYIQDGKKKAYKQ